MGARGPAPKRSDQRRRRNKPGEDAEVDRVVVEGGPVVAPAVKKSWHPAARAWYESLAASGQSTFYEPSDWATAWVLAESMSRELFPKVVGVDKEGGVVKASTPMSGQALNAYLKGMSALLVTEGDRRRARVELVRGGDGPEEAADVSDFESYRRRARQSG